MASKKVEKEINEDLISELNINVRSSQPIIQVNTVEEARTDNIIGALLTKNNVDEAYEWSCTTGFLDMKTKKVIDASASNPVKSLEYIKSALIEKISKLNNEKNPPSANDPCNKVRFYILRDISPYFTNPQYTRFLREIAKIMPNVYDRILITNPISKVPQELDVDIARIDLQYPREDEIAEVLDDTIALADVFEGLIDNDEKRQKTISACLGLSKIEIEGSLCKAFYQHYTAKKNKEENVREVYEYVLEYKAGIVKKNGILEYIIPDAKAGDVGGLKTLKEWLVMRSGAYSPEAKAYGLPTPKGAILLGIPGTGKSLCAKAAASILGVPLIRLDVGKVFGSLVGESEAKMQQVLKTLEAIGTAILFIDEMDKAFAGVNGGGGGDSGTSKRVFGTFLTWLQEKKANIFVLATVNDASHFPPELLRKGRFDEIFYVGLPSINERKEIFKIHIEKKGRKIKNYDLDALASETKNFTGAEIENVVAASMYRAFYDKKREFTTEDLLVEVKATRPMADGMKGQISYNNDWAKDNAKPANEAEEVEVVDSEKGVANVKANGRKMSVDE